MLAHSMPAQQHVSTASVMYDTFRPWPSSVVMIVEPDFCQPSAKTCIGAAVDDEASLAVSAVAIAKLNAKEVVRHDKQDQLWKKFRV